jgi:hypothetical protein
VIKVHQAIFVPRDGETPPPGHVLTPGGYRDVSLVHAVPSGHTLRRRKGRLQLVERSTRRIRQRYHELPPDAPIPGIGSGWITYAWWRSPGGAISSLTAQWIVPPAPATQAGQTIFLFNALEDDQNNDLLQPVLQWGASHAGGGDYWAIANWFINQTGDAFFSPLRSVMPGDVLTGVMTMTAFNGTTYGYTSSFLGHTDIDLTVSGINALTWAAQTLEAYQIGGASYYPNTPFTSMSYIAVGAGGSTPGVNWQTVDAINNCGESTSVTLNANPGGQIEISYA